MKINVKYLASIAAVACLAVSMYGGKATKAFQSNLSWNFTDTTTLTERGTPIENDKAFSSFSSNGRSSLSFQQSEKNFTLTNNTEYSKIVMILGLHYEKAQSFSEGGITMGRPTPASYYSLFPVLLKPQETRTVKLGTRTSDVWLSIRDRGKFILPLNKNRITLYPQMFPCSASALTTFERCKSKKADLLVKEYAELKQLGTFTYFLLSKNDLTWLTEYTKMEFFNNGSANGYTMND